jgi:predicted nucleotidyltransferase
MDQKHWEIIKAILQKYPYTFYAFGSRIKGTHKRLSDLDICFMEKIPTITISLIREEFEESRLPFTVDLVDWNTCDETFKSIIKPDLTIIQTGTIKHNK